MRVCVCGIMMLWCFLSWIQSTIHFYYRFYLFSKKQQLWLLHHLEIISILAKQIIVMKFAYCPLIKCLTGLFFSYLCKPGFILLPSISGHTDLAPNEEALWRPLISGASTTWKICHCPSEDEWWLTHDRMFEFFPHIRQKRLLSAGQHLGLHVKVNHRNCTIGKEVQRARDKMKDFLSPLDATPSRWACERSGSTWLGPSVKGLRYGLNKSNNCLADQEFGERSIICQLCGPYCWLSLYINIWGLINILNNNCVELFHWTFYIYNQ